MILKKSGLWFGLITLGALGLNLWLRLTPFDFVWDGRVPWERLSLGPLTCLLYTSPSPRDRTRSRMPSSA